MACKQNHVDVEVPSGSVTSGQKVCKVPHINRLGRAKEQLAELLPSHLKCLFTSPSLPACLWPVELVGLLHKTMSFEQVMWQNSKLPSTESRDAGRKYI